MTISKRDLIHKIIAFVLLPLLFFPFLPYITCQQESGSADRARASAESVIGVFLLATFLSCMIACCLFYAFHGFQTEAAGGRHEVLQTSARRGLDKEAIESFPSFLYSEVKELKIGKGGVECAICLNEFEDEETLRWMPPCSHTFHANCIDIWLSSQSTCPVCRETLSMNTRGDSFPYPRTDLESGNAQRGGLNSPDDISLIGNNNNVTYTTTRSRSTGFLSSWRIAEILFPRSHSTGHSMVQQVGENLDRFTLQLPEEVQRQLISMNLTRRRRHMALPRASSSRQGYRSGNIGRQTLRRAMSMSISFSFQAASVRSTHGMDDLVRSQTKDNGFGERSFERLVPEKVEI